MSLPRVCGLLNALLYRVQCCVKHRMRRKIAAPYILYNIGIKRSFEKKLKKVIKKVVKHLQN